REIVRFVLAEGKSRGDGVADLLGLQRISKMRAILVRIRNADKRDSDRANMDLSSRKEKLLSASGIETLDDNALLTVVNTNRIDLGLPPVVDETPEGIVAGVDSYTNNYASHHKRSDWISKIAAFRASLIDTLQSQHEGHP